MHSGRRELGCELIRTVVDVYVEVTSWGVVTATDRKELDSSRKALSFVDKLMMY